MDRKLALVPQLTLIHGDLDRAEYVRGVHRDVRESVSYAIGARKKNQGPRPVRRLYDAAEGSREPAGPLLKQIEGIAAMRDHAEDADLWKYDHAIAAIALRIHEEADHAIWASNERRRRIKGGDGAA